MNPTNEPNNPPSTYKAGACRFCGHMPPCNCETAQHGLRIGEIVNHKKNYFRTGIVVGFTKDRVRVDTKDGTGLLYWADNLETGVVTEAPTSAPGEPTATPNLGQCCFCGKPIIYAVERGEFSDGRIFHGKCWDKTNEIERELTASRDEVEKWKRRYEEKEKPARVLGEEIQRLTAELDRVTRERDDARAVLKIIADNCPCDNDGMGCPCETLAKETV